MSDPKKEVEAPKPTELSTDELDAVTGGAIDAFLDFSKGASVGTVKGESADASTPTGGEPAAAIPGGWNRVKN